MAFTFFRKYVYLQGQPLAPFCSFWAFWKATTNQKHEKQNRPFLLFKVRHLYDDLFAFVLFVLAYFSTCLLLTLCKFCQANCLCQFAAARTFICVNDRHASVQLKQLLRTCYHNTIEMINRSSQLSNEITGCTTYTLFQFRS